MLLFTDLSSPATSSSKAKSFIFQANQTYQFTITAIAKPVAQWLAQQIKTLLPTLDPRNAPYTSPTPKSPSPPPLTKNSGYSPQP